MREREAERDARGVKSARVSEWIFDCMTRTYIYMYFTPSSSSSGCDVLTDVASARTDLVCFDATARGYYLATPHRVVSKPSSTSKDRISVPYFWNPRLDAVISPIDPLPATLKWSRPRPERPEAVEATDSHGEGGNRLLVGVEGGSRGLLVTSCLPPHLPSTRDSIFASPPKHPLVEDTRAAVHTHTHTELHTHSCTHTDKHTHTQLYTNSDAHTPGE